GEKPRTCPGAPPAAGRRQRQPDPAASRAPRGDCRGPPPGEPAPPSPADSKGPARSVRRGSRSTRHAGGGWGLPIRARLAVRRRTAAVPPADGSAPARPDRARPTPWTYPPGAPAAPPPPARQGHWEPQRPRLL